MIRPTVLRAWHTGLLVVLVAALALALLPASAGAASGPRLEFEAQPVAQVLGESDLPAHIFSISAAGTGPVTVRVVGHNGNVEVTASLVEPPTDVTLSGTTTRSAVNGLATFDDLEVQGAAAGDTFRLRAEVTRGRTLAPDVSGPFRTWAADDLSDCSSGDCVALAGNDAMSAEVSADAASGFLLLSLLDVEALVAGCEERHDDRYPGGYPYNHAPGAALFDAFFVDGQKIATIIIDRDEVNKETNNGASFYQVCYLSDAPFIDRYGDAVEEPTGAPVDAILTFGPALLPDCGPLAHDPEAPCVISRTKSNGDVYVRVLLPAGDPMFQ